MTQPLSPQLRLEHLDLDLIRHVLADIERLRGEFFESEKRGQHKIPQQSYASAVYDSQDIASYKYALGAESTEVRFYLAEAAHWMERVFQLRGTTATFPVTLVTLDPAMPLEKRQVLNRQHLHPPDAKDYSLTNSRDGLRGVYLALTAGDPACARHIAEMMGDPPDATYIGPDSEVCTPDQQHLAYAAKHLLLGAPEPCLKELTLINSRTAVVDVQRQAEMVRAIAVKQPDVFMRSLEALLAWHTKMAQRKANQNDPSYFLLIPGLGLVALARLQGVMSEVPLSSVYLPLELLTST
jgi:hypothetical protein